MRTSKPITVTLGKQQAIVDDRLASGEYESASEVVRAGLRALEREEKARNEVWRRLIQESLDDPRPDVPAEEVFAEIEDMHKERMKAGR
ncbi:type II toxin-antitoxin system ParD family antitoxin [Mesorhizobium australicum]|uniref:Antitoxin ParD1/3/4 n=1 Tax=Mesorhizobium australicum TaxID=536018 RepID=A0A1X7NA76_9HYPH|nr:type II toxin-antitoxin system ParD family antitoxin [Mesorhizobium australicum]SMH34458.1 antitoxin ParD1/3/4 [Mesorhizobium australicum]